MEVIKRDERVNIVHHVTMFFIQGTGEQGMLRRPSPHGRVVLLLPAALDGEPDRDVALEITQLSHRESDENAINAG